MCDRLRVSEKLAVPILCAHSFAIAEIVNHAHPGRARFVDVPGMDHGFTVGMKFHAELIPLITEWMKEALNAPH